MGQAMGNYMKPEECGRVTPRRAPWGASPFGHYLLNHLRPQNEAKLSPENWSHPVSKTNSFWPIKQKKSSQVKTAERLCRFKYFGDFCVDVCDSTFSNTTTFESLPQALHKAQGCTWLPSFHLSILNLSHHLQHAGVHLGLSLLPSTDRAVPTCFTTSTGWFNLLFRQEKGFSQTRAPLNRVFSPFPTPICSLFLLETICMTRE